MSGNFDGSGLEPLKEDLREGDTVVVWRLDRLGRSLKHLISLVNEFEVLKVGFESLQESINTTTSTGQLIFHMSASKAYVFQAKKLADNAKLVKIKFAGHHEYNVPNSVTWGVIRKEVLDILDIKLE